VQEETLPMRMIAALLLAAFTHSPQDEDLPAVLKRMAEPAARIDALAWHARTWYAGRDYYDRGNTATGAFVRGRGMRIEVTIVNCSEPQEHRPDDGPNRFAILWTPEDLTIACGLAQLEDLPSRGPPHVLARAKKGDPALDALDPLFVNPILPVCFVMNSPLLLFTLDPELMMSYEPGLRLVGRDKHEGRECWRLQSSRSLAKFQASTPRVWYRTLSEEKTFHVDVETGLLAAITYDQILDREEGKIKVRVASRVAERGDGGLPIRIDTTVDEQGMVSPTGWRQTIHLLPGKPAAERLTGWDARRDAPAGPITMADVLPPAPDATPADAAAAHLQRFQHRALRTFSAAGMFKTPAELEEFVDSMNKLTALGGDEGRSFANLHWFWTRGRRQDKTAAVAAAAAALPKLAPNVAAYFAVAFAEAGQPKDALAMADRAGALLDPQLRELVAVTRLRARAALGQVDDLVRDFAAAVRACGSFEEQLHLLWHVEEAALKLADDGATRKLAADIEPKLRELAASAPAFGVALASWQAWQGKPDDERRTLESLLDAQPDDPWLRHLYMRTAWRQLATSARPRLSIRLNRKLGPYGDARRTEKSADSAERDRARAFAERMKPWAEAKDADPRAAYLVALAHVRAGDNDAAWPWTERAIALTGAVPDDSIAHVSASRVYAEIAHLAYARGTDDALERSAQLWQSHSVRSAWPDAEFLKDHERNPLRLHAARMIRAKDWPKLFRMLATADTLHAAGTYTMQEHFRDVPIDGLLKDVLASFGAAAPNSDYLSLAAFLFRYFPTTEQTMRTMLAALEAAPKPDLTVYMERAGLSAALRDWERAAEAATAAHRIDPDHHEGIALYAARTHGLRGKPQDGLRILEAFAKEHKVNRAYHFGVVSEELGDVDAALRWFEEALKTTIKPYFNIGRLYERLERWDDAMRCYNRALTGEGNTPGWPPAEDLPVLPQVVAGLASSPAEGRFRILAKLGQEHYIDRLLKEDAALTQEERKKLDGWTAVVGSIDAPSAQRMDAAKQLRAFGKRAAPAVHALLKSDDVWAATIARDLLSHWAEPR